MSTTNVNKIKFTLEDDSIDFFKLNEEYFSIYNDKVSKQNVLLQSDEYLDMSHLEGIDWYEKDTIVLNFQVGRGKTTLLYNLIDKYYKDGFYVIVCSPYHKLINKDFENLTNKYKVPLPESGIRGQLAIVFNYLDVQEVFEMPGLGEDMYSVANKFRIHIMTTNCLLGNPGENAFEQRLYKREYISNLLEAIEDGKAILVFDEIHDSIGNFKTEFLVNLFKWKEKIAKVFISSATYSSPCIPVINLLSSLTNKDLKIFESNRIKDKIQAEVTFHMFPKGSWRFFNVLRMHVREAISKSKQVNIICPYKNMARVLANKIFGEDNVVDEPSQVQNKFSNNKINLLTAETDVSYQAGQNNIGTTFKTGIDITDSQSTLFIILPSGGSNLSLFSYGIYTGGISAVVQALGRLRNGGKIHLFGTDFDYTIDGTHMTGSELLSMRQRAPYFTLNDEYRLVREKYFQFVNENEIAIRWLESALRAEHTAYDLVEQKSSFGFWYKNFHEFLLNDRRASLMLSEPCFGKYVTPYVSWALLRNQFTNATLKHFFRHSEVTKEIILDSENPAKTFLQLLQSRSDLQTELTFRSLLDNVHELLGTQRIQADIVASNRFTFKSGWLNFENIKVVTLMQKHPRIFNHLLQALLSLLNSDMQEIEKYSYLASCMQQSTSGHLIPSDIKAAYRSLNELRGEFEKAVQLSTILASGKSFLPSTFEISNESDFVSSAINIILRIKDLDRVIHYNAFSWLQKLNVNGNPAKSITTEFLKMFFNYDKSKSSGRRTVNGLVHYVIDTKQGDFPVHPSFSVPLF